MHKLDLTLEREAVARLNQAIALCLDRKDAGTRELLEHLLIDEEESVDWLETQLNVVNDIGRERYLAEQVSAAVASRRAGSRARSSPSRSGRR